MIIIVYLLQMEESAFFASLSADKASVATGTTLVFGTVNLTSEEHTVQ